MFNTQLLLRTSTTDPNRTYLVNIGELLLGEEISGTITFPIESHFVSTT